MALCRSQKAVPANPYPRSGLISTVMSHKKTAVTKADRAREAFADADNRQTSKALPSPLMPWLNMDQWFQIEYQRVEIWIEGGQTHIHGERKVFCDGEFTEETVDANAPLTHYLTTVDQMQQQTQRMMQAMLMPWLSLMQPFIVRDREQ
jgi:hypothetical protein